MNSITLSLMGISLIVIPISTGIVCGLTISNKVIFEISIINIKNNMKKIKTIKSFDKLYLKFLQDNVIVKNEYESQM